MCRKQSRFCSLAATMKAAANQPFDGTQIISFPPRRGVSSTQADSAMSVLRGELFKEDKLRWCEISADGMLTWADKEDQLPKDKSSLSLRGALITPEPDRKPITAGEARYGLRITLSTPGTRVLSLQAASDVERQFWVEAMEKVAHDKVAAFRSHAAGRTVVIERPSDGRLGIDLGQPIGTPCVTVVNVDRLANPSAAQCGLLVGDVIVAVDNTVLRTHEIAARVLSPANAPPGKRSPWRPAPHMIS